MTDINKLVDLAADDQGQTFADTVHGILYAKANDQLETMKADVTGRLFNKPANESLDEAKGDIHSKAVHVEPTSRKKNGQFPLYRVIRIGSKVDGIKVGTHLTDSDMDDLSETGHKVKTVK